MNHVGKERIKSAVIAVLFAASIIQIGILWGYQGHRFPISILAGFFGPKETLVNDDVARDEIFVPYKLIVSNGNDSHWLFNRTDDLFEPLWNEAKVYLGAIANGKLSQAAPETDWGGITTRRGFVFEFKTGIRPDLLKWFLKDAGASGDIPLLLKMMVIPDTEGKNSSDVYILSNNDKVFKYQVPARPAGVIDFTETITAVEEDKTNSTREYGTMREYNFDKYIAVGADVLVVARQPKYRPYGNLACDIPKVIGKATELEDILLGNEKDRYIKSYFTNDTIQFKYSDYIYRVYNDGFLEYDVVSNPDSSGKGRIEDALMNAYKFVTRINMLTNQKAALYISSIEDTEAGFYRIRMDYLIDGMPIYIKSGSRGRDGNLVENAIVIDVNEKQVLKCRCLLRDYSSGGKETLYLTDFFNLVKDFDKQLVIKDISTGYVVESDSDKLLEPLIVIEKMNNSIQVVKMPVGGD